jgi:hypothetical protein
MFDSCHADDRAASGRDSVSVRPRRCELRRARRGVTIPVRAKQRRTLRVVDQEPRPRSWPTQVSARIQESPLTIVMRRHRRVPLLLKFVRDGAPVARRRPTANCKPPTRRARRRAD